jgi:hypothetical protein
VGAGLSRRHAVHRAHGPLESTARPEAGVGGDLIHVRWVLIGCGELIQHGGQTQSTKVGRHAPVRFEQPLKCSTRHPKPVGDRGAAQVWVAEVFVEVSNHGGETRVLMGSGLFDRPRKHLEGDDETLPVDGGRSPAADQTPIAGSPTS